MIQSQTNRRTLRRSQKGFGVISALLGLVIGAIITMGQIEGTRTKTQVIAGSRQGDLINLIKTAANDYSMENYPALQSNLPVTKNGVTLAVGNADGQSMSPRVQDLVAMGYLSAGTTDISHLGTGVYRIRFRQEPIACVGTACNIPGNLFIDQPIFTRGTTEMNNTIIGAVMEKVGGDVLVSLNTSPTQLTALSGAAVPNPVAGNPPGVVGARVGFGASGFGRFLVMNDPRDPNFQGDLTVGGTIHGRGAIIADTSVGVGTGAGGCRLGEIIASGNVLSRSAACVRRAWLDGTTGQVGVADAAGVTRALLDGTTGEITSRDGTGAVRSGFGFQGGGQSVVFSDNMRNTANTAGFNSAGTIYGDNLRNNSNTAGIRADGTVFGSTGAFDTVVLNNSAVVGAACGTPNSIVWGSVSGTPILLKCEGGVWSSATGVPTSSVGAPCATPNKQGITTTGVGLICQGGQWMLATERMGKFALLSSWIGDHGTIIAKPACGSGGAARIFMIPSAIDASHLFTNYTASDIGASWRLNITDNNGNAASGRAIAEVGCFY